MLVGDAHRAGSPRRPAASPGLSVVYIELLDFGGDEIYFNDEPALVGQTFGDALLAYEDSAVIGIAPRRRAQPRLNPPMDTLIERRRPADRDLRGRRHDQALGSARAAPSTRRDRAAAPRRAPAGADAGPGLELARAGASSRELDELRRARARRCTVVADGPARAERGRGRRAAACSNSTLDVTRAATPPTAAVSTRSRPTTTTTSIVLCYSDAARPAARRRADAGHAAAPARHRGEARRDASRSSARCSTCATASWPR